MKQLKVFGFAILLLGISLFSNSAKSQEMMSNEKSLSSEEKSIVEISALAGKGDLIGLNLALKKGLEAGLTVNQIKEVLVHLYAYSGFPRSIRGLQTFMAVLEERKAKGITDSIGKEASPIQQEGSKYERGKKVLGELTKAPQPVALTGYSAFAPAIDVFLKEHLFADIFERDVLSYRQRELVTISVLSSIGGVEPMLQGHLNISLNVGLTPEQLRQFISVVKTTVGVNEAQSAQTVLDEVLKNRKL